jgi:hypothetical protein
MNALAEVFSDSVSSYTKRRKIFTDANSNTASSESEMFSLRGADVTSVSSPYESNTLTIRPYDSIVLCSGDIIYSTPSLQGYTDIISGRQFSPSQNCNIGQYYFTFLCSEASTLPTEPRKQEVEWSACLAGFVEDEIEDGMTAALGEKILNLIQLHGATAIERLKDLIISGELSPLVASHTLRWLGRIKDSASFDSRLKVLCENLRSKSPVIRDGASLGLAALGATKAISFLQEAINREKLPGLRADMEQVLRELQN